VICLSEENTGEEVFCEQCGRLHPPKRKIVCGKCGETFEVDFHSTESLCPNCRETKTEEVKPETKQAEKQETETQKEEKVVDASSKTKQELIRELLNEIQRIRKARLLVIEEIDKQIEEVIKELNTAKQNLFNATTKMEIWRWNAVVKLLASKKHALDSRRHLSRMLYKEEGRLKLELARLEAGRE